MATLFDEMGDYRASARRIVGGIAVDQNVEVRIYVGANCCRVERAAKSARPRPPRSAGLERKKRRQR
jgi:hypothetical protein